nr:hypothetical protein CFP56_54509 [Quercus suber]
MTRKCSDTNFCGTVPQTVSLDDVSGSMRLTELQTIFLAASVTGENLPQARLKARRRYQRFRSGKKCLVLSLEYTPHAWHCMCDTFCILMPIMTGGPKTVMSSALREREFFWPSNLIMLTRPAPRQLHGRGESNSVVRNDT